MRAVARPGIIPLLTLVGLVLGVSWALLAGSTPQATGSSGMPPNFKVAFIGDQGINSNAQAALKLILAEGADMVLHQGDFGYGNELDPQTAIDWDNQITKVLGAGYPYFASVGNHDVGNWTTYQQLLLDRLALIPGASCSGDYGVQAACTYQGLFFILSGAGTLGSGHTTYITDQLAQDDSIWRVCSWHKNQNAMQVGSKPDEVGWGPYEACRQGRAIIATAHEHSYERTKTLGNTQSQTVDPLWSNSSVLRVSHGSTFVFVSGLAGRSIRNQDRCLPTTPPYGCNGEWASIYTSDQSASFGALFIEFNVGGDPNQASGYFKNIGGTIIDSFTITADHELCKPLICTPTPTPTITPTPTPKDPTGDTDGDTIPNATDPDDDNDGCTDVAEQGVHPQLGGQRDPHNFWDFYDTPNAANVRDKQVDLFNDIFAVALRFSASGDPTGDPLAGPIPAAPAYHTAFDRSSPPPSGDPWDTQAANGTIDLFNDIFGVAFQFGHSCS